MNLKLAVVKQAKDIIFSVRWVFFCSQLVAVLETLSFITAEPQKLSFSKGQLEISKGQSWFHASDSCTGRC